jgi:urea transport system ATP-binding protein
MRGQCSVAAVRRRQFRAVLPVERYFEFARALADYYAVMARGEVVPSGETRDMVEGDVRRYLTV